MATRRWRDLRAYRVPAELWDRLEAEAELRKAPDLQEMLAFVLGIGLDAVEAVRATDERKSRMVLSPEEAEAERQQAAPVVIPPAVAPRRRR